ncbi:MAG: hypothetical protein JWO31_278 [Phycisphaerales bacterium]|nr:hypothetical protein [Phycisphaerales bacterium]
MTLGYYAVESGHDDGTGSLPANAVCRVCGTGLGGLPGTALCPGCGTPGGRSVYGDLLRYADPEWVRRVWAGVRLQFWSLLALALAMLGVVVWAMIWGIRQAQAAAAAGTSVTVAAGQGQPLPAWATTAAAIVPFAAVAVGVWWTTAPEPPVPPAPTGTGDAGQSASATSPDPAVVRGPWWGPRRLARGGVVGMIAYVLIQGVVQAAMGPDALSLPADRAVLAAVNLLSAVEFVAWTATAVHLARLAVRVPDLGLAARSRIAAWGAGSTGALLVLMSVGVVLLMPEVQRPGRPGATPGVGMMIGGCAMSLVGLALLGFFVFYLVALGQAGGRLRDAAAFARLVRPGPLAGRGPFPPPVGRGGGDGPG